MLLQAIPPDRIENGTITIINNDETDDKHKEGTATFFKTCFNGLNAMSGIGLLSVPYALAAGGWLSLILLFTIAIITFFTGLLLRRCMDLDRHIRTYPDIGARAFGNTGRIIARIFCYFELYLVATGFLILEGDNLHNLFTRVHFHYSWINISGRVGFVISVALIILPSVWIQDLNKLSYVSATGLLACFVVIASVFLTGAVGGVGFHGRGRALNLRRIPTAFSLYTFCYSAHTVFPTLYTSMKDKTKFNKVMLVCFVVCTAGYTSMAVLGYLMYGENVNSQVTLNLAIKKLGSKVAIYTTLIIPVTKYALVITPIASAVEDRFFYKKQTASVLIRTLLLISTVILALVIPFFGDLMSLVGAFFNAGASIIIPCVCYLKLSGTYKKWSYELAFIIGILLMGVSVVVIGTYTSLSELMSHWRGHAWW